MRAHAARNDPCTTQAGAKRRAALPNGTKRRKRQNTRFEAPEQSDKTAHNARSSNGQSSRILAYKLQVQPRQTHKTHHTTTTQTPQKKKGGNMKKQSPKKQTNTQRGYGYPHQQARKRLIHNHKDGTPCQYCGQPMYRDKHKNWDGYTLEADHEIRQKDATNKRRNLPTRLLHKTCNSLDGARAQWGLPHTPPQPPKPKPKHKRFQWKQ